MVSITGQVSTLLIISSVALTQHSGLIRSFVILSGYNDDQLSKIGMIIRCSKA